MDFSWKMAPKMVRGIPSPATFYDFVLVLFATSSEDRFLNAIWSPFCSLWAPFWLPFANFWLPLGPFWVPLDAFGSLLLTWAFRQTWKAVLLHSVSQGAQDVSNKSHYPEDCHAYLDRKYTIFGPHRSRARSGPLPLAIRLID